MLGVRHGLHNEAVDGPVLVFAGFSFRRKNRSSARTGKSHEVRVQGFVAPMSSSVSTIISSAHDGLKRNH